MTVRARETGFTLIELLFVAAMLSIMLAIAVPSFRSFISSYRVTSATNEFLQAVVLTRNEALKRGRRVVMLPNDATGTPSATGDWKFGWTVFVDANNNMIFDGTDSFVAKHLALDDSTVPTDANGGTSAFYDSGLGKSYVSFNSTGYPQQMTGGLLVGGITFTDSAASPPNVRTLCLASMGSTRVIVGTPPPTPCT